jgi:hypothetical protein
MTLDDKMAHVRAVKAKYEARLMKKPNVVGVGIGLKPPEEDAVPEPALIVNVTQEIPMEKLRPRDRIPRTLEDVRVHVEEIGVPQALKAGDRSEESGRV